MAIWVPVSASLRDHPKLLRLADVLGCDHPTAMGLLLNLWSWAVENAGPNGELPAMTEQVELVIFRAKRPQGRFVTALVDAGFIDDAQPMLLHNWHEWGGKYAAKRHKDRERARRNSAKSPRSVREVSAKTPHTDIEVEEEREVELTTTPSLASLADAPIAQQASKPPKPPKVEPPDFVEWYTLYPRKAARPDALKAWLKLDDAQRKKAMSVVMAFAAHWSKRLQAGDDKTYIPHPASYLNGHRFEDDLPAARAAPRRPGDGTDWGDPEIIKQYGDLR